jgi:hypothetical protein
LRLSLRKLDMKSSDKRESAILTDLKEYVQVVFYFSTA